MSEKKFNASEQPYDPSYDPDSDPENDAASGYSTLPSAALRE